jgi:hypothetical protein
VRPPAMSETPLTFYKATEEMNLLPLRHEGTKEHKADNILHSPSWCAFVSLCLSGGIPFSVVC